MTIRRLALLAFALLPVSGCGWYYLEPDPNQVAVGQALPGFELPNRYGEAVSLDSLLDGDHNAVLVFYRGHW